MKIRITTVSGMAIDLDQPPGDFSFNGFVTAIRANGHFMAESLFIPMSAITAIWHYDPEQMPAPVVVGMTKQ